MNHEQHFGTGKWSRRRTQRDRGIVAQVPASTSACRTHLRSDSLDTFTFYATEQIASHREEYCPTCSNTNATARSRTSREYLIFPDMIHILTHMRSLHQTRGGSDTPVRDPPVHHRRSRAPIYRRTPTAATSTA